jgi:hypothetical protein
MPAGSLRAKKVVAQAVPPADATRFQAEKVKVNQLDREIL